MYTEVEKLVIKKAELDKEYIKKYPTIYATRLTAGKFFEDGKARYEYCLRPGECTRIIVDIKSVDKPVDSG